ncbi:MAG TPA: S49 family peptidase [Xanthobacteraceae bacterium]|jgi:signal peptide peptidase SppA|nr:S49 family peptidase [Xanthobacteraceae bacterium]
MTEKNSSEHLQQLFASAREALRPILPKRLRGVPIVPVVRLAGVIGFSTPLKPGLTLATIARALERAFNMRGTQAVALSINSPGGSPVQSHLIYRRIRQLAAENARPVIAFAEDVAASGGYMIACAADEIFCDPSSIVGSIGVVGGSFGFPKLMDKVGVERRLYVSGEHKAMLDPFLPENPQDVERLKALQQDIHEEFIALVKRSRGARLKGPEKTLFSGEYWTGGKATELGLADGIGDLRATLRARFGDQVVTPFIAPARGWFGRVQPGVAGYLEDLPRAADFAEEVISALEARALWARYGL